ncbi:MAG: flagellar biosynthetic protein FliR [Steroidobacteraceae bacterium]|nr:flagellar biosynthetic protein FliR [Steroidobacteraceae bacterium]
MATVDLDALIGALYAHAWPFLRITGLLLVAPVFSAALVPRSAKMVLAITLAVAIAPTVPPAPALEPLSALALLTAVQQLLIGVAIGFAVQVVFDALLLAGQVIALTAGLGFATLVDPSRGVTTPVVGQLYIIVGLLMFLAVDGHLLLLQVLADSFLWMPPGPAGIDSVSLATLVAWGGRIFEAGIVIALPAVVGLLVLNIALGVISRAAPQLNLFSVGFPLGMLFGFLMLVLSLPALQGSFERLLADALDVAARAAGAP